MDDSLPVLLSFFWPPYIWLERVPNYLQYLCCEAQVPPPVYFNQQHHHGKAQLQRDLPT